MTPKDRAIFEAGMKAGINGVPIRTSDHMYQEIIVEGRELWTAGYNVGQGMKRAIEIASAGEKEENARLRKRLQAATEVANDQATVIRKQTEAIAELEATLKELLKEDPTPVGEPESEGI